MITRAIPSTGERLQDAGQFSDFNSQMVIATAAAPTSASGIHAPVWPISRVSPTASSHANSIAPTITSRVFTVLAPRVFPQHSRNRRPRLRRKKRQTPASSSGMSVSTIRLAIRRAK